MFFYVINYNGVEEGYLCMMEMKSIFNFTPTSKCFFSDLNIDIDRSPFIKEKINIMLQNEDINVLIEKIKKHNIFNENFKVKCVRLDGIPSFEEKLGIEKLIGEVIEGNASMHNPSIIFGVTCVNGLWIFGEYQKNSAIWIEHCKKPYQYSNAISTKLARSIVNIAIGNNFDCKMVDPCCGVGTVVLEALSMGIDIKGYDINYNILRRARENLDFFNLPDVLKVMDMHTIEEHFDVAVIDIPYGVRSVITKEEQEKIIESSKKITNKLVLITIDDRDDFLKKIGYSIIDKCIVGKESFIRHITLCSLD